MDDRILVLGAAGLIGGELVARLAARGAKVRASTRTPELRRWLDGVEAARLDLEKHETFAPALEGIQRVFMIARPGDDRPEVHALPLIEAMRRAGVGRVVLLSAMGAERRPDFGLRKVELALEGSGMAWTHLRPNFFFQVFTSGSLLRGILTHGELRLSAADARLSFLDGRDVAAVAAAALTEPGHEGQGLTLTGGEALDHAAIAQEITRAAGRPVSYVPLDEDQARRALAQAGFPPPWVDRLVGFYRLVRAGACAPISPDVERVLGRPPHTFAAFAHEHAAVWRS